MSPLHHVGLRLAAPFINGPTCLGDLERRAGQLELAAAYYRQALPLAQQIGNKSAIKAVFRALAELTFAQANFSLATQLFAAAEEYGGLAPEIVPTTGWPQRSVDGEPVLAALQQVLGEAEFRAQWAAGKARPLREILG